MGAMDSTVAAHLGSRLQARSGEISRHWYEAIAHTSFVPRPVAEVRAAVAALTERVIATLLRDPFAPEEAGAVGAALAQLHYMHPDALARSLDVLGRELTAGL